MKKGGIINTSIRKLGFIPKKRIYSGVVELMDFPLEDLTIITLDDYFDGNKYEIPFYTELDESYSGKAVDIEISEHGVLFKKVKMKISSSDESLSDEIIIGKKDRLYFKNNYPYDILNYIQRKCVNV